MLNANDPGRLADALIKPGRLKTIQVVKNSLLGTPQEGAWETVVNGYRSNLLNDLPNAGNKIAKFQAADPDALNEVMSPIEQKSWQDISQATRQVNSSLASRLASSSGSDIENAASLAKNGNLNDISSYVTNGGPQAADAVRGAVFKDILDRATVTQGSKGSTIDPAALSTAIRDYTTGGRADALAPVLRGGDQRFLDFMGRYSDALAGVHTDAYGSLRGGAMASKIYDVAGALENPGMVFKTVLKLLNTEGMGRVLATPAGQNMTRAAMSVPGGMNSPSTITMLAKMAGYGAQLSGRPEEEGR
jgi:hypothetical protein